MGCSNYPKCRYIKKEPKKKAPEAPDAAEEKTESSRGEPHA
ncbi:hypothetical protein [Faecalibaculum rodentium]